jgi:hypothetical protein
LDIQHFLQPFTVTSGEIRCLPVMIQTNQIIDLYFVVHKLTWTHEEDIHVSPQMVGVALRILNMCVPDFCVVSVVWPVWVRGSIYGF